MTSFVPHQSTALSDKAQALLQLQQQQAASRPHPSDPRDWWQSLLVREQVLIAREKLLCESGMKFTSEAWDDLHQRSEQISRDMATCLALLGEVL